MKQNRQNMKKAEELLSVHSPKQMEELQSQQGIMLLAQGKLQTLEAIKKQAKLELGKRLVVEDALLMPTVMSGLQSRQADHEEACLVQLSCEAGMSYIRELMVLPPPKFVPACITFQVHNVPAAKFTEEVSFVVCLA